MAKTAKKPIVFSKKLSTALVTTANRIWPDAAELCESNEELAEMVIDADRVRSAGFPAEHEELMSLVDAFGFGPVQKAVARVCNFV